MKTILGREPVVAFELLAGLLLAAIALLPLDGTLTVALNAAVVAAASLATAAALPDARDKVLPALLAFARALMAVWIGLGFDLSETTQAGIIGLISAAAAFFVRQQVTPRIAGAFVVRGETMELDVAYDEPMRPGPFPTLPDTGR
jgi:hypothetical protein